MTPPGGLVAKKKSKDDTSAAAPPDPREALPPEPASWNLVLAGLKAVLADLAPPAEPQAPDFVECLLHIYFADGLPCGYGQEVRRRIAESFVDRNEFRVTEAYEVEDLLRDLPIPGLFERCLAVRESVAQIYNDQNGVNLAFLRDAGISDRNTFFQRVPAVRPHVATFLSNLLTLDEIVFSDKSTLRAQQRIGIEAKDTVAQNLITEARQLLKPWGHLPLQVGKHLPSGKPNLTHVLSPACLLVRLAPAGKKRG
jgi:hypothetical protein